MQECFSFCFPISHLWWINFFFFFSDSPFLNVTFLTVPSPSWVLSLRETLAIQSWKSSRPVHVWLTALFDSSGCHGDLLNSTAACFLHLLFSQQTNERRLPGCLQWLPEWALNLQWKAANIPEWQERKRRKPTEKGKNKPEDGNETNQMTVSFNRISTQLSPFQVLSKTSHSYIKANYVLWGGLFL